jgi:hypothetical protein
MQSKLANVLFTYGSFGLEPVADLPDRYELHRRLQHRSIEVIANCCHPGIFLIPVL